MSRVVMGSLQKENEVNVDEIFNSIGCDKPLLFKINVISQ